LPSANRFLFTSICNPRTSRERSPDQIHAILDACLREDPNSRRCETLTCTGSWLSPARSQPKPMWIPELVRGVVQSIGYDKRVYGFDSNTCAVISSINKQSGTSHGGTRAAPATRHDVGYACNETPN